ncbi:carbohydrate ABC transporter permease [Paenibacillus sp. IITD108]|uniref:carbohydrate ABC transporter permease n=1 Tax=Paenibacillus sp. IITD108 TaxID=3116649 RepID=UPI002F3F574A
MKMTLGERSYQLLNNILITLLAATALYPFIYMTALALNEGLDSIKGGIYFWPRQFTWVNVMTVLTNPLVQDAFWISIMRTVFGTALGVVVTGFAAYALSFRLLPGRKALSIYFLIPMLFSGGLIPYYIVLRDLHLINTFWVYIIPTALSVWNLIVMRSFFENIPEALTEAAEIDGANALTIFWRVVIPTSMPMLAAITLFTAVAHWNSWFDGAFYVNQLELKPLQTFLQSMLVNAEAAENLRGGNNAAALTEAASRAVTPTSLRMAVVVLGTIPVLLIYPFLQKYFVQGVLIGSVKG